MFWSLVVFGAAPGVVTSNCDQKNVSGERVPSAGVGVVEDLSKNFLIAKGYL